MTKPDPKDGTILNFNSPEEQEAVEVVFNNAITPLAEVGLSQCTGTHTDRSHCP